MFSVAAAVAAAAVLCCGCSDYGVGGAFTHARNGGNNECGKDGTVGSCKKITIDGGMTWLAENLNYKPSSGGSWCYDNRESYCNVYGRLYTWEAAKAACQSVGMRLPSRVEWDALVAYAGGYSKNLKSTYGWGSGNGTDDFGFSALPGGFRTSGGGFDNAGYNGLWWTATELSEGYACLRLMFYGIGYVREDSNGKSYGISARCVQD